MVLSFLVDKQIITRVDKEKVVRDSMNYLYANFEFSPDWVGEKTAVFKSKSGAFNVLLDDDGKCLVPWEVLVDEVIEVSVFCGALITANVVKIITIGSGYTLGESGRVPTPGIYEQIIAKLNEIEAEIEPEAIQALIDAYLADKDFVTEAEVETIVATYVEEHSSLDDLTDVDLTTPQSGDVLVYDGQKWENKVVNGLVYGHTEIPMISEVIHYYALNNGIGNLIQNNSANMMVFNVAEGEKYRITGSYKYNISLYSFYANSEATRAVATYPNDNVSRSTAVTETVEITIPSGVTVLRACSYVSSIQVEKLVQDGLSVDFGGNILYGKKWCACGDSFTSGDFGGYVDSEGHTGKESDAYDPIKQMWKTYPWWISERNNMNIQLLAQAGNDFTNVEGAVRPFSNPNTAEYNYTQVATDCDYITLMFGLNETTLTTEQIGTRTDTTNETLWGAYNIVLEALITANPFAKIGIIISDAWITQGYHDALVAIAQYWGIPYLDLRNGVEVPMMIGGRLSAHSAKAETLRNDAFRVSANNGHPNLKAHEYRSTVIENFLRSL